MKQGKVYKNIAFLTTFPPKECGIANFTEDLIQSMDIVGNLNMYVIAINEEEEYVYNKKVISTIRKNEKKDYSNLAEKLNHSEIDLLMIEHEYGIYGGKNGEYILELLDKLEIPVITTFHTILPSPEKNQKRIIYQLGKKSEKVITMAHITADILETTYEIPKDKIEVIHHGVPKREIRGRDELKLRMGYENREIISTFGLLGPGKGIEHGIEAIAKVVRTKTDSEYVNKIHKSVLYLILGQTHPSLGEKGKEYRVLLENLVSKLKLEDNVLFINKYLTKNEIITYLQLSDIYMTPYLAKDQAVSGTLAYAVGYGKAIVSTPYLYAKEMLSKGGGLLGEFANPDSLAECIKTILEDPFKKARMERDTMKTGRTMYWDEVALQYIQICKTSMDPNLTVEVQG